MFDLTGKGALVTGATGGIGWAIAETLHAQGATVAISGTRAERLNELAAKLGSRVAALPCDLRDRAAVVKLAEDAEKALGQVDILVNNAGIQYTARVEDFPGERWDAIIAINLSSNFHAIRAVLPGMRTRNWGRIINIASVHGLVASVEKSAYVAAKHGVIGLTKVVALETATTGITCNAICPGFVLTPLVEKQIGDRAAREKIPVEQASRELLAEKQPSLAFATPEQIGALTVFLCSDAAAEIRGTALPVDGGWTAQ